MEYLIGLLIGVVFLLVFLAGMFVGYKFNKRQVYRPPEANEREQNEMKRLNDDFKKLFNYDVSQAIARKELK